MSNGQQPGEGGSPGTGAPEPAGTGAPGTETPGGTGAAAPSYQQRIQSDPEFAWQENRNLQSHKDRAEGTYRDLLGKLGGENGALMQYVQQYGADTVAAAVNGYAALRSHDRLGKIVTDYEQTGEVRFGGSSPDPYGGDDPEEYLTPEQKEIRELRAQVAQLGGTIGSLQASTGSAALQGHLEQVYAEFYLTPQETEDLKKAMEPQFRQWQSNTEGQKLLQSFGSPDAYDSVKALALKHLPSTVLEQYGERKRLREQRGVERFRTDGPPELATQGTESPPKFEGRSAALEALRASKVPGNLDRWGY